MNHVISENTKSIIRQLANAIRDDIRNINGDEVSLDILEGRILENDEEGCIQELAKLTKYKSDLLSQSD